MTNCFKILIVRLITTGLFCMSVIPAYASDWMIIGSEPDIAPHRSLYVMEYGDSFISHRMDESFDENAAIASQNPLAALQAHTIYIANVLQVFENAGGTNFIHYEVEFKCQESLVRIAQATSYDRAGKPGKSTASQWLKVSNNWMAKAEMIACKWKDWEAAELAWQQRREPSPKNKKSKASESSFARLGVEYFGDYAAWTTLVDAVWANKWADATQPAYVKGTPEELKKLKQEGLVILDKAKAIGSEQVKWNKISIALSDKADRLGGKLAQEMATVGGQTEDQIVARWGVPQRTSDHNGVRQLNYNWQNTETSTKTVTVDIMGPTGNGTVGKIGETYEDRPESRTVQCYRTLFLQEGGALEKAYRVFDFDVGCN